MKCVCAAGLKIRPIVLVGAVCTLVSCGKRSSEARWWELEQTRIGLDCQLRLATYRWEAADKNRASFTNYQQMIEINERNTELIESMRVQKKVLHGEILATQNEWDKSRDLHKKTRRSNLIGKTFEVLSLEDGRHFNKVRITNIDDAGVAIRHSDGTARLDIHDLGEQKAAEFGIEKASALVALAKEEQQAIAYEQWHFSMMRSLEMLRIEKNARNALAEKDKAKAVRSAAFSKAANTDASLRPLAQPPRPFGASSIRWRYPWRTYSYRYRPVYVYQHPKYYHHAYNAGRPTGMKCRQPTWSSFSSWRSLQTKKQPSILSATTQHSQRCIYDSYQYSSPR